MSNHSEFWNQIRKEGGRNGQQFARSRVGFVTSYDPDNYACKVRYMPEGNESGWMPALAQHIGNGFGVYFGLNVGDQVEVGFQENDPNVPRVIARLISSKKQPPRVEAGEFLLRHGGRDQKNDDVKKRATVKLDKDGNLLLTQGEAVINIDDSGNTTITKGLTEYKIAANGDVTTIIKSDPDTVLTTHKIGNDGRVTVTAPPGITFNGPFNVNGAMNLTGDLTQTGDTHQVGDLNQTGGIRSSDRHVAPLFDGPATSLIAGGAGASTSGVPSS